MSSAVSTTDVGLELLGSSPPAAIASLRTCTRTESSRFRSHLGRFSPFERRCQAYGLYHRDAFTNTSYSARFRHTRVYNEWNADFAYLFCTLNGLTGAAGCDVMLNEIPQPLRASGPFAL